jgi:hypothetical protein
MTDARQRVKQANLKEATPAALRGWVRELNALLGKNLTDRARQEAMAQRKRVQDELNRR